MRLRVLFSTVLVAALGTLVWMSVPPNTPEASQEQLQGSSKEEPTIAIAEQEIVLRGSSEATAKEGNKQYGKKPVGSETNWQQGDTSEEDVPSLIEAFLSAETAMQATPLYRQLANRLTDEYQHEFLIAFQDSVEGLRQDLSSGNYERDQAIKCDLLCRIRKKASRRKTTKSRVLREYKEVKATLLARKKELEAELKDINAALKG